MNGIDIGLIVLFLVSILYGYRRGFVGQAVRLLGLLISLTIAYSLSQNTAVVLQQQFPLPKDSPNPIFQALLGMVSIQHFIYTAISFVLLFFVSRFLWSITGKILDGFAKLPIISYFNHWLGALFGCIQVLIIVIVGVNVIAAMPGNQWKDSFYNSHISQYILQVSPFLSEQVKFLPKQNFSIPNDPLKSL